MRRCWGVAASLTATALLAGGALLGSGASANGVTVPPAVKRIDATAFPKVSIDLFGGGNDVSAAVGATGLTSITSRRAADAGVTSELVYVVDTSSPMALDGRLDAVKQSLAKVAAAPPAGTRLGLVTAGTVPVTRVDSVDGPAFAAAVADLHSTGQSQSSMRDALAGTLALLRAHKDSLANVVVITASTDTVSGTAYQALHSAILDGGVTVGVVAVDNPGLDASTARSLAADGRGPLQDGKDPSSIGAAIDSTTALVGAERRVTVQLPAGVQSFDLVIGGQRVSVAPSAGFVTVGTAANPTMATPDKVAGPSFLQSDNGKVIAIGLATVAIVLFAVGIALLIVRKDSTLDEVLMPYAEGGWSAPTGLPITEAEESGALVETKFVQRAVEITRKVAQSRGVLVWFEKALERADVPVHPAEFLFFYSVSTAVLSAFAAVMTGSAITAVLVLGLLIVAPPLVLNFLAGRRRRKFQSQLPDTLNLLAGSLKAGYSLMQGVAAISQEIDGPMGKELRRIVLESRLGRPLEDAMNDSAARMGSADFEWAVMAINIQREVGGNLAELLMTVADTMVQRERLRRDVKSLTAEGRMSAIVIGALPVLLGFAMYSLNPGYMRVLFNDHFGQMLLGGSILLALVGFWWMKKTIEVEV